MSDRRKLTAAERQQIYEKFGGRCAYCGCEITIKDMQADHVVPLHLGGEDDISNLYPACRNLVRFGMIARPRTDVRFWFERW